MVIPEIDSASSDDERNYKIHYNYLHFFINVFVIALAFTNSSDSASSQSTVEKDSVTPPRKYAV